MSNGTAIYDRGCCYLTEMIPDRVAATVCPLGQQQQQQQKKEGITTYNLLY